MTFLKITDFKSKPSIIEYLCLYTTSSAFVVLGTASLLGNLSYRWALLSFAVLLISAAILNLLKQTRGKRAEAFYKEWLDALSTKEIIALQYRLKDHCREKTLLLKKADGLYNR